MTKERLAVIYALCDPDTQRIRYIGRTVSPGSRYLNHLVGPIADTNPKRIWIDGLVATGELPTMRILKIVKASEADRIERGYLFRYSQTHPDLLNTLSLTDLSHRKLSTTKVGRISQAAVMEILIKDKYQQEIKTMNNRKYYAWASNDQGASVDVMLPMSERRHSIRAFEDAARNQLGSDWTVHIMQVDIDGDGQSVMGEPHEIKTFTIR